MDIQQAREILQKLYDGINPMTDERLPPEDSCHQGDVVRALNVFLSLDLGTKSLKKSKPKNA